MRALVVEWYAERRTGEARNACTGRGFRGAGRADEEERAQQLDQSHAPLPDRSGCSVQSVLARESRSLPCGSTLGDPQGRRGVTPVRTASGGASGAGSAQAERLDQLGCDLPWSRQHAPLALALQRGRHQAAAAEG